MLILIIVSKFVSTEKMVEFDDVINFEDYENIKLPISW